MDLDILTAHDCTDENVQDLFLVIGGCHELLQHHGQAPLSAQTSVSLGNKTNKNNEEDNLQIKFVSDKMKAGSCMTAFKHNEGHRGVSHYLLHTLFPFSPG